MNEIDVISPEVIIKIVAGEFKITPDKMLSKSRRVKYCIPRHICRFFIRLNTSLALRDTTVIHSCLVVTNLMETDDEFSERMNSIQSKITAIVNSIIKKREKETQKRKKKMIDIQVIKKQLKCRMPEQTRLLTFSEHEKIIAKYL
jgi:Bacterial dnaA protein helix-turn-helix